MKLTSTQLSRSAQSLFKRVERMRPSKGDYHSELRYWVQHVILKAKKNKNFKKKDQFLDLLKDLNIVQRITHPSEDL